MEEKYVVGKLLTRSIRLTCVFWERRTEIADLDAAFGRKEPIFKVKK